MAHELSTKNARLGWTILELIALLALISKVCIATVVAFILVGLMTVAAWYVCYDEEKQDISINQ